MSKRIYQKRESDALPSMTGLTELPTNRPIAIYYRQSTDGQVGNISTSIQTIDMVEYLKMRGWAEDHIIMVDRDKGVSGTTAIDERPGMKYLYDLITEQKIGAVACQDEDRLFRDVTQIQVNIFVDACKQANVLVLTPSMVYDFANEMTGMWHARQFRFKSEMAAEYINTVIKARMHRARERIIREGKWGGAYIPAGYMVDMRRTLPDGSRNENWRKYAIFEPYAEVVREYFNLFLASSGNLRKTWRHIKQHGPYYPKPDDTPPPEGFQINYKLKSYDGRYHPSKAGLHHMLMNARFIGHWLFRDTVVKWHNHPALVDEGVFMQTFNYLSEVTLDGQENKAYRPIYQHARPSKDEERSQPRPLCAGLVFALENDEWRRVGTTYRKSRQHYVYAHWSAKDDRRWLWKRKANGIDEAVAKLVQDKLSATFSSSGWRDAIALFQKNFTKSKGQERQQLIQLEQAMANLISNLDTLTNPQMVLAAQNRYETLQQEYWRIEMSLTQEDGATERMRKLNALQDTCGPALENWELLSGEEKRAIISAFVFRVEATPTNSQGVRLKVVWRDSSSDKVQVRRQSSKAVFWTDDESAQLHALVTSGAGQVEIAAAFPNRLWREIRRKYMRETGHSETVKFRPSPIKFKECYYDYLARSGTGEAERICFEDGRNRIRPARVPSIWLPPSRRRRPPPSHPPARPRPGPRRSMAPSA